MEDKIITEYAVLNDITFEEAEKIAQELGINHLEEELIEQIELRQEGYHEVSREM